MFTSLRDAKIVFIGAGSMAEAMVRGLIRQNIALPEHIAVLNRSDRNRLIELKQRYRIAIPANEAERDSLVAEADIVVLAMKPKDVVTAASSLKSLLHGKQMIVSLVAGLSIATMQTLLGNAPGYVRSMPNTSSTIGLGATGISFSATLGERQKELASDMFEAIGVVSVVQEDQLALVTGISGCGPAYVYYLVESLIRAAVDGGMNPDDAKLLAAQTALGAANMLMESGDSAETLRRKVSSPGGATMAAIEVLDQYRFSEGIARAVNRAAERTDEMGEEIAAYCLQERP